MTAINKRRSICLILIALLLALTSICMTTRADAANIIKGDTKENIRIVQQRLKELGYYKIKVDGIWGPKTLAGVKNFQRDYGLVVELWAPAPKSRWA